MCIVNYQQNPAPVYSIKGSNISIRLLKLCEINNNHIVVNGQVIYILFSLPVSYSMDTSIGCLLLSRKIDMPLLIKKDDLHFIDYSSKLGANHYQKNVIQ